MPVVTPSAILPPPPDRDVRAAALPRHDGGRPPTALAMREGPVVVSTIEPGSCSLVGSRPKEFALNRRAWICRQADYPTTLRCPTLDGDGLVLDLAVSSLAIVLDTKRSDVARPT